MWSRRLVPCMPFLAAMATSGLLIACAAADGRSRRVLTSVGMGDVWQQSELGLEHHQGDDGDHGGEGGDAQRRPDAEEPKIAIWQAPVGCRRSAGHGAHLQLQPDHRQPARTGCDIEDQGRDDLARGQRPALLHGEPDARDGLKNDGRRGKRPVGENDA